MFIDAQVIRGLSQADYFAIDALSRSDLVAINESAVRWKRCGGIEATKPMDFGTLVHAIALEDDESMVVEVPHVDWRSKESKEMRDAARAEGKIPVLSDPKSEKELSMSKARRCAAVVLARWPFLKEADTEIVIVATHEETGLRVKCRLDYLLGDLKTTQDASPEGFRKSVSNYMYADQAAFYGDMAVAAELAYACDGFTFNAVESNPPYLTGEHTLYPEWIEAGRRHYEDALLKACNFNETNWPIDHGVHVLRPRSWDL